MKEKKWYDEDQELPSPWEWVIVIVFSASIMAFGWLVYLIIPERPRQWDFGQLPDTPAESVYSTDQPDLARKSPRQIHALPEARPLQPGAGPQKSGGRKP
jgi:hypothetical protein